MRLNTKDHKKIAEMHGFLSLGLPIIISGCGKENKEAEIEVNLHHFKKVKIAKSIALCPQMIVLSHFKGHILFGFGGAIKNLAMGCSSRAGKLAMHSIIRPCIKNQKCTACKACINICPANAIIIDKTSKKAKILDRCIGCAECISVCPKGAVEIPWHGATPLQAMERAAEYALGAVKGKKCLYITFINNITSSCDCMQDSEIIAKDAGVVASVDPVAIDKAAYDILKAKNSGKDVFQSANRPNGTHIMKYAEDIGLGKRDYELINI